MRPPPGFVINLKSRVERWNTFAAGAAKAGLQVERVEAVDTRTT
jgi:GR25 family glycosyltransferase involved in LPS biosynthesis